MIRSLLYTVQRVLEKLDLDAVNSINDSQDAILVAREAESTYYDLLSRIDWPERKDLLEINPVSNPDTPTFLRLPDNVLEIYNIWYDVTDYGAEDTDLRELCKLEPEEFLRRSANLKTSDANVSTVSYNQTQINIITDKQPEYYTTFDNEYIILDSYDSNVETTVQGNKTTAMGLAIPVFLLDDSYVIPLDATTYPLFLAELTAAMSMYLNGNPSQEDEMRRARGIGRLQRKSLRVPAKDNRNKFGRSGDGRS